MNVSTFLARAPSLNAKVGAVALALAALSTLVLSHTSQPLAPLRLLALSLPAFAAWAFCDEMGLRKPLNRAGFVFFAIAVTAKVQIILGVTAASAGRYPLLYASFLLAALLFWSVAFLHRARLANEGGAGSHLSTARRYFCAHCGSALWLWDPTWPDLVHPHAGAIDTPLPVPPDNVHCLIDSKAPWVRIEGTPDDARFQHYPSMSLAQWHEGKGLTSPVVAG